MFRSPSCRLLSSAAALVLLVLSCFGGSPDPGTWWRLSRGLDPWDMDLDPDGDGWTTRAEYLAGTDPFTNNALLKLELVPQGTNQLLRWPSMPGVSYQLLLSVDLTNFVDWMPPFAGTGNKLEVGLATDTASQGFFALGLISPTDVDGDGLSSVEEAQLGTNPELADTDGDGFPDGLEVLEYFTNPLVFDHAGGTIAGTVYTDPNRDGNVADGVPVAGVTVWLDANYDGVLDDGERRTATDAAGAYAFPLLAPGFYHVRQLQGAGSSQTLPATVTTPILDGWPDELAAYVHSTNGASFSGPYGYAADRVWPGGRWVMIGQVLESVDPALILKPAGVRHEVPPIGIYNTTEALSLSADASVTVRFSETIVDGPGNDLAIIRPVQGSASEISEVWLGSTTNDLRFFGTINQNSGGAVLRP